MPAAARVATLVCAVWLAVLARPTCAQDAAVAPPAQPELSPQVMALITPVRDAIAKVQAEQAQAPPAADDRQTLARLRALDQAAWQALSKVDFSRIPPDQKVAAKAQLGAWIQPVDQADADALISILPPEGWFAISRYGADGEEAAYLIVMHADIDLWRRFAPVVGRFAAIGEANGAHYALLADRLAVHEDRPQSFGSQITCVDGVYKPYPIDDPENLDARRLRLGLAPYAVFTKTFEGLAC